MRNLNAKTQQFQKRTGTLLLGSIFIIHKPSEDVNHKDMNMKAMICHKPLKTMLQRTYPRLSFIDFKKLKC